MTVSILETLRLTPYGTPGQAVTWEQASRHIRDHYDTDAETNREARHRLRDELYCDGGVAAMEALIDLVFTDVDVRDLRKRWVKQARFNNAIKRIVNELSTVYSEPAVREVEGIEDDRRYQEVQHRCRQAEQSIRLNRLLNLHRAILVGFRCRDLPDGEREPVIDIATPSIVRAVVHPNDSSLPIGWLIRVAHRNIHNDRAPTWMLWTSHEKARLTEKLEIIGTPEPHGFGRCPWVPISRGPLVPGFWPGDEGEDLVAAQMAIWFANICMLKETKSATNQTILTGDLTALARGQAMDTETPIEAPEGVGVSTVDMSMDTSKFGQTADHILEAAGNNYGMSLALLKHQGVQSAAARELMRVPIRELRREQQVPLRQFERAFVEVQRAVLEKDMPELAFNTKGWTIDFGEGQTPLTEQEAADLYDKQKGLGLTNPVDFLLKNNPDLTEAAAIKVLERNAKLNLKLEQIRRPLYALSGEANGQPGAPSQIPAPTNGAAVDETEPTPIQEMAS